MSSTMPRAPALAGAPASSYTDGRPMISRRSRWLLGVAAACLAATYVFPLWHIGLRAPQYPEGLGMYIWSSQITGQSPYDLRSINGLNHYIGMQEIVPDSIPELRIMPAVIGGMIALGLVAALWGRRSALYSWTAALAIGALVGLADFWRWGYDYGHNLNPSAAIKIPGMSYQPPLIGTKQLLNFQATSVPAIGGWLVVLALVIGLSLSLVEARRARQAA